MHQLGFVLFTYLAAVLYVGAGSPALAGVGIEPHFLFLVVVTAVLYFENWTALVWAAVAGLVSDGLSAGPLGVEMACFMAAAFFLLHRLRRQVSPGIFRLTLLTFVTALAALAVSHTVRLLLTGRQFDHARLMLLIASTSAMTALVVGGFRALQMLARKVVLGQSRRAVSSY